MAADKFPQWLNLTSVTESAAAVFTQSQTAMPVRISALEVMEILAVEYEITGGLFASLDADVTNVVQAQITEDSQSAMIALNNSNVIDKVRLIENIIFSESTETGGAGFSTIRTILHNFAPNGKGFLYAGQSMFVGVDQFSGNPTVMTANIRILYRLVKVTANELIGLVRQ